MKKKEIKKTVHAFLKHLDYNDKAKHQLEHVDGLVYPATRENIKEKLY
jgi:gamma-glutamyl-gamma-aminobutyrate hydrolase PuuD